jgi:hypothetical protein
MPFGVAADSPARSRAPLEEMVDQDTFGTPWRRGVGSDAEEDRQPRARRISSTTDA